VVSQKEKTMHKEICKDGEHNAGLDDYCKTCEHLILEGTGHPWEDCPADCIGNYFKRNFGKAAIRIVNQNGGWSSWWNE
jgi:hypothetical protein